MSDNDENLIILTGRVGEEPTFRQSNGRKFITFDIAVNFFSIKDGSEFTRTTWVPITVFGSDKYLQGALKAIHKGYKVMIKGWLSIRKKIDQSSNQGRNYTSVVVDKNGYVKVTHRPAQAQAVPQVQPVVHPEQQPYSQPVVEQAPPVTQSRHQHLVESQRIVPSQAVPMTQSGYSQPGAQLRSSSDQQVVSDDEFIDDIPF